MKILFTDYELKYTIIELIGEWNDAIENDIMTLRREITDELFREGISRFILITENVLNFHSSDDAYYEDWFDQLQDEGGWVALVDMPEQTQYDFKRARLTNYARLIEFPQWRTLKPEIVYQQIESEMIKYLEG
jgi:MFS superfamily sulfate permease-like transporter